MTETIYALSSGPPPAAIAIIRISGPAAHTALEWLAGPLPPPRQMVLRNLRDPASGDLLDRALIVQFPAGQSATGEPLAELHLHGGKAVVDAISGTLAKLTHMRSAVAGEFTWRAFHNGRIDLLQVESLSHLLRAETEAQRRAALGGGALSTLVELWRQRVLMLSAHVEARLDQSDADDVSDQPGTAHLIAEELAGEIGGLLSRPRAERLFDGIRVVFAGPPNAGKSTLMNLLAGREVAIVSPIAGTTRDVVEAPVQIGGVAFVLTDTAGLRAMSEDSIEQEGMARAAARIEAADIVVWMHDIVAPPTSAEVIVIQSRADVSAPSAAPVLRVSAVTGEGIAALTATLLERAAHLLPVPGETALLRRQHEFLHICHVELVAFIASTDDLIAAEHLRRCRRALDDLTGRAGAEDMLDALFATFCVGK